MRSFHRSGFVVLGFAVLTSCIGCGPPTDPSIVYKKMTPEEFAALPPEDRELPEVMENMGDQWKDPSLRENASNPRGRVSHSRR